MKKKKLKLKKQAYYILAGMVSLFVLGILGMNFYNDYQYKQTNEAKLLALGYTLDQAKIIEQNLENENTEKLLTMEKNDEIIEFIKEKYFLFKNLNLYLEYKSKEEEKSLKDIIALVNTHASKKWYSEEFETIDSINEKMLVNKFYGLKETYTPQNLKVISMDYAYGKEGENQLIDYAYDSFIDLWESAHEAGHYLMVTSSYRDYESQKEIYDYRKSTKGERKADESTARPGHSEHQTGLVIDMTSKDALIDEEFKNSEAYKWLKDHAHEFGFIERYPEGKTYITGYSPESWHWRYVGKEIASIIHEEQITFDEYYAYYLEK